MYLIELHTGELVHPSSLKNGRVVGIVDCIIPRGDRNKPECANLNHDLQFTKPKQNWEEMSDLLFL